MNVGDSRAIASIKGLPLSLSYDHKPNNIGEQTRIVKAGGFVELNRVNGNLALSRALGDFSFKRNLKKQQDEQIVSGITYNSYMFFDSKKGEVHKIIQKIPSWKNISSKNRKSARFYFSFKTSRRPEVISLLKSLYLSILIK